MISIHPAFRYLKIADLCVTGVRHSRRTTAHPWHHIAERTGYNPQNLTQENKDFIDDITFDIYKERSPLIEEPWERGVWSPESKRTGVICRKIGVIPQWDKNGCKFAVTLLQVADNHVISYIDPETWSRTSRRGRREGLGKYGCLVVGADSWNPQVFKGGYRGLFEQAGVMPKKRLHSFIITPESKIEPGTRISATHFKIGQYIDVAGRTTGHGFQGVMKRWKFKGGKADYHGTSKQHRRPGAIGTQGDANVKMGKHMPGHMGMEWRFARGLKIFRINTKYNVLYVQGLAIPGPTHHYVCVRDSIVPQKLVENPPFPTHFPEEEEESIPEELFADDIFQFTEPSVHFQDVVDKPVKSDRKVKKQAKARK